jgi:hypothetical protein
MGAAVVATGETAVVLLLLGANYGDKVIPLSISLSLSLSLSSPACFLCMVAADGDPLCVLAKCKE